MEYGAPPPDPTGGIGGYNSPMPRNKSPAGFSDDSMPDGSIDEAITVPPVGYNNLILPSGIPGSYNSIPQNTELPQCVMSSEDQTTPQHDSGQESDEESDMEKPMGREWPHSEEESETEGTEQDEDDDDEEEDEEEGEDDEEVEEDGIIPNDVKEVLMKSEEQLTKDITGWQSPSNGNEDFDDTSGSESGEATNAEPASTDSETESNEEDHRSVKEEEEEEEEEQLQESNLSPSTKSDKTLSPDSVLCFDEYGNLTTYRPEVPAPPPPPPPPPPPKLDFEKISNQEFLEAAETLESEMSDSLNAKKSAEEENDDDDDDDDNDEETTTEDEVQNNEIQNNEIKSMKNRPSKSLENSEASNVSDQEWKQAFKEEFLTAATSRYGRARKRKTEDGFFFGTINFNELRKITSTTSPKKCKGVTGGTTKGTSPEQKAKTSKIENKFKTKLDEVMEDVIRNGPTSCAEVGIDKDSKGDINHCRNTQELSTTKGDNDIVQNSLSSEIESSGTDGYVSPGDSKPSSKDEDKILPKNDSKSHHKGKSSHKKEMKGESALTVKQGNVLDSQTSELKSSLEDDVEQIKRAEKRKRLSLPRRKELSLLRDSETPVNISSDRMLRRRSDVWKIKNSLQPKKSASSKRRSTRNSNLSESETNETPGPDSRSPSATIPNTLNNEMGTEDKKKENSDFAIKPADLDSASPTAASPSHKETPLGLPHDPPVRRLRSSHESSAAPQKTPLGQPTDIESHPADGSVTSSASGQPKTKEPVVSSTNLDSHKSPLETPVRSTPSAKSTRVPSSRKESTPATSSKEDESGSMTKFGRLVRKPQLMDVSIEAEKQKMEQIKNKEMLSSSIVGDLPNVEFDHSLLEKQHPCEHMVGDLLWVLLKGNPLWPAMISYQPDSGEFTRLSVKQSWQGKLSCIRLYYVQFFNDNSQTYWIAPTSALPFAGYAKLQEYLQDLKHNIRTMKGPQKLHADSMLKTLMHIKKISKGVPSALKGGRWMVAIEEGELAMAMDRYERLQKYALKLDEKKSKTGDDANEKSAAKKSALRRNNVVKKRKGRPSKASLKEKVLLAGVKSSDDNLSTDGEFSGFDENYSSDENRNVSNLISEISSGHKQSFAQYAAKHLQRFILENPNISETAARTKLRWRWKKLANSQAAKRKSRLLLKNDGKEAVIPVSSSLKRKHRNSVERDSGVVEDGGEVIAAKRKRVDETRDSQKGVYKVVRNEKVCQLCEGPSTESGADMIRCKGVCYGIFHLNCVGLSSLKIDFKCIECQTGEHRCFVCKSVPGVKQRCTVPFCGKFYHDECIQKWPQVSKNRHQEKFVCPRHVCHMCAANADDMNDPVARNPQFTRCLRCPTTYHTGEECIAAGSEEVSLNNHICTKHLKTNRANMHHVNVSWCFCCSKGGSLLLCDQCPAAFHADCMKITTPEGSYVCEDCENGKFPVYGDVVWVKLGLYRWWPGQVLHPRFIPDNIENLPHQQGMFCVHFFGSNDYYWVTRGRAFHYQEGDKGSKAASSKTLEMQFQRAIQEALEAYREHRLRKAQLEAVRSGKGKLKPPPYVRIDSNRPVGNVRLNKLDLGSVNRCECDPFSENPCGSDEKCLNRMLMFECVREVCGSADRCGNQRFQKRLFANVRSFRTEERGWGLKTLDDIKKGDFVIEYVGELIDDEEFHRRIEEMHMVKEENYYFLTIDKDIMIDAGPKGNLARFMNHSCEPNCETQKWTVGGDTRVGLFALYDIPANAELTFNYNLQCVGTEKKKCNCGAANCSGFIGAKVQKNDSNGPKREKLPKRKRKRKRREIKISEDECYRCGGAGDLIMCDVTDCPKSYHLLCLSLDKLPKGKWICPWHHCDECGQRSIRPNRCDYCPNSFCRTHVKGNLQHVPGVGNVCQDHDTEDIETLRGQMEAKAVGEIDMTDDDPCAMDGEQNSSQIPNHLLSCDVIPSYANDTNVDSSSCIYENALPPLVSQSSQEQEQADTNTSRNTSVIVPLRMKENRCRPKKLDRVSEGYENNSSVINVNNDACLSQMNSKTYNNHAKTAVTPKNGIRGRRSATENMAKAVNVV